MYKNANGNLLLKLASNDVREYLEFAMGMGSKTSLGSHAILVDDT